MAGHNKWSKIKHKKAASDARKSEVFGKLSRLIAAESKRVGGDPSAPGLRLAIEKARGENMPRDNIERAIARGKNDSGALLENVVYEAYGPGGTALIITGLTDNKNRTSQEVRHLLKEYGIELTPPGGAAWAFEKQEDGWHPATVISLSELEKRKLDDLASALLNNDNVQEVYTNTR